jgi:hypothetical protein
MLLDVLVWYLGETDLAGYVCINKSYIGGTQMRNQSVSEQAQNIFFVLCSWLSFRVSSQFISGRFCFTIVLVHHPRVGGGLDRDEPYCRYFEAIQSVLDSWTECEGFTTMQTIGLPLLYLEGHKS